MWTIQAQNTPPSIADGLMEKGEGQVNQKRVTNRDVYWKTLLTNVLLNVVSILTCY
jgi:hypothetical protein